MDFSQIVSNITVEVIECSQPSNKMVPQLSALCQLPANKMIIQQYLHWLECVSCKIANLEMVHPQTGLTIYEMVTSSYNATQ